VVEWIWSATTARQTPKLNPKGEDGMQKKNGRIIETATEARGAERGPTMAVVLGVSTVAIIVIFAGLWFFFLK
jgi:hypothetical protein